MTKMAKKTKHEIYPNAPLVEVVSEIRFPAELAIDCQRDRFYEMIRKSYPEIRIPNSTPNTPLPLQAYRFENAAANAGIMLAIDRCSYYQRNYEGHEKFIGNFLAIITLLKKCFAGVKTLKRIGWRYINLIPFVRENELVPLRQFLAVGVDLPKGIEEEYQALSMVFETRTKDGRITTKIESLKEQGSDKEAILLDFDFAMTETIGFGKLRSHILTAHDHTRSLFEKLITDNYRNYLRGNTL